MSHQLRASRKRKITHVSVKIMAVIIYRDNAVCDMLNC